MLTLFWMTACIPENAVRFAILPTLCRQGQERFGNMTRVYYREAVGAFIVFDVSRASTFEAVSKWKNDLDSKVRLQNGNPVPAILLANKCDQTKEGLSNTLPKLDQYCKENGFIGWFETSAKDNIHIEESARLLVENILSAETDDVAPADPDIITSQQLSLQNNNASCSACTK
ncbi:ras-related protein Rab-38-like isoform X2 [Stegostoma tigrinum]|uniref:ras-related protein Rab-38-like isoform X2 n=1 Tax=Stegostoma tigrinum TaxID=3053191 RepID=UPI00202B0F79|nr:ras-related protein Rab-38-like isoform X2 [Stegostoma tigrinum]